MPDERFDLVFCRNLVFTYFTRKRQIEFLRRLSPHLKSGGVLILGAHEQLPPGGEKRFEKIVAAHPLYRKK